MRRIEEWEELLLGVIFRGFQERHNKCSRVVMKGRQRCLQYGDVFDACTGKACDGHSGGYLPSVVGLNPIPCPICMIISVGILPAFLGS